MSFNGVPNPATQPPIDNQGNPVPPNIVEVQEIWNGRTGNEDDKGERNYTRVFRVITISPNVSSLSVRYAYNIPARFDPYMDADGTPDAGAFAQKIEEHQDQDDPRTWVVVVQYSSKLEYPDYGAENPLNRPSEIEYGSKTVMIPLTQTPVTPTSPTAKAIVNSAGSPFDPAPEIEQARLTMRIVRNEPAFDPVVIGAYADTVNNDAWLGFQPGEVKCTGISAKRAYEKGIFYWQVTYEFECKPGQGANAWAFVLLDRGYYTLDNASPPHRLLATDLFGRALTSPALLDGTGKVLSTAANTQPVFITYYGYVPQQFANLNLP
jgi:hypothetical protein